MNATANTTATASTDFKIFTVNARLRDYAHELHEAHGVPLQEHEEGDSFAYLIDSAIEIAQGIVARREAERLAEEAWNLAWKNFWRRIVFLKPLAG